MFAARGFVALIVLPGALLAACGRSSPAASPPPSTSTSAPSSTTTRPIPTTTTRPLPTTSKPTTSKPRAKNSFAASPTSLGIGSHVTLTGNGCPSSSMIIVLMNSSSTKAVTAQPGADGTWTTSAVIADATDVGAVQIFAQCQDPGPGKGTGFFLNYTPVTLHISTYRRLLVAPSTTARPGQALHVTATGGCTVPGGIVGLSFSKVGFPDFNSSLHAAANGDWVGDLVIPATTPKGSYAMSAECTAPRSFYGSWLPVTITVT